jgi:hypothetical protein
MTKKGVTDRWLGVVNTPRIIGNQAILPENQNHAG